MPYDYEYVPTEGQPIPGIDFGIGDTITGPRGDRARVTAIRGEQKAGEASVRFTITLDPDDAHPLPGPG